VGQARPGFSLGSIDGRMVSADEFEGKTLLINFWATWCVPCRKEMPMLVEVQEEFADQGLAVVGIALDEVDDARSFAEELGVTYTILVGSTDVMQVNRDYGNMTGSLPYTVLVDKEGVVRWIYVGELKHDGLVEQIQAVL
jgi:peroxiredoxin